LFVASNLMGVTLTGIGALNLAGTIFEGNPILFKPGNPLEVGPGKPLNAGLGLIADGYLATCYCCLSVAYIIAALLLTETGLTLRISSIGLDSFCGDVIPPRKLSRSSSFLILSCSSFSLLYLSASAILSYSSRSSCSNCSYY